MPTENDKQRIADLEDINAELTTSLDRCRAILRDCRNRLSANSNEPDVLDGDDDQQPASSA
jgi:hypothetical protein